jgi:membrane protein implicated in regulation of membrane protease activity
MERLLYLYLTTGIFGVGVITILFLTSAFGSADDEDGSDDSSDSTGDESFDDSDDGGEDSFEDSDDGELSTDDSDEGEASGRGSDMVDYTKPKTNSILALMSNLRNAVYFCVGFGATGTFALLTGESELSSLIWSLPVGLITVGLFRLFKSVQQKKLDSTFSEKELVNLKGKALLSFSGEEIGKVQIQFGEMTIERYAKCNTSNTEVHKGDEIVITRADDNYVYITKL